MNEKPGNVYNSSAIVTTNYVPATNYTRSAQENTLAFPATRLRFPAFTNRLVHRASQPKYRNTACSVLQRLLVGVRTQQAETTVCFSHTTVMSRQADCVAWKYWDFGLEIG